MPKVEAERRDRITVLTVNRPEVHNCIDSETAALLEEAIVAFGEDNASDVLVVTGAGSQAFSSGADLKAAQGLLQREAWNRSGPLGFARLDPGKPTIAAVNGYCFAGGLELACWCDFRIASENAEFGVLNRRWGVPLVDGGTQRLPRIVGQGNAMYLALTGARIDARRALAMGLVQEVVPPGRALARSLEVGAAIAGYPQASLRADRRGILLALGLPILDGLEEEAEAGIATVSDPEMAAGIARFAEGDRPDPPRPAD
jgi:enoyl-CoA hydratase